MQLFSLALNFRRDCELLLALMTYGLNILKEEPCTPPIHLILMKNPLFFEITVTQDDCQGGKSLEE